MDAVIKDINILQKRFTISHIGNQYRNRILLFFPSNIRYDILENEICI